MGMTIEVTVDARKRISLGELATREKYLADVDEDGVITLAPAVTLPEMELRLLAHPDILDAVENARTQAARGEFGPRPVRRTA